MDFLYPNFLFGLIAVIFPIMVHLFNFQRYKVVYFSNFQFLQNLQMQTKRQSNVKRWLLLLIRILIIVFVVLAFAHPYSSKQTSQKIFATNTVCVFVDNSFSMAARGENNTLVNQAKTTAKQIALSFAPSDKFILLTNDLNSEQFRTISRDDFILKLDNIKVNGASKSFSEVFPRVADLFSQVKNSNKFVYLVSDFQKSAFDLAKFKNDTSLIINLVHIPHPHSENISIDSCWFEQPIFRQNQNLTLYVQVHNYSNREFVNLPISFTLNGKEKASAITNIAANSISIVELNFSSSEIGILHGEVEINDPSEITFDNNFYLSFKINATLNILEIADKIPNQFIKAVFETDSIFKFTSENIKSINYNELSKYDLIILYQPSELASGTSTELTKYVKNGGLLCIIPPSTSIINPSVQNFIGNECLIGLQPIDTAGAQIQYVNVNHPLFKNVFDGSIAGTELPIIKRHFKVVDKGMRFQELFKLTNSDCVFGVTSVEKGLVYVFGIAPDDYFGNFSHHPLIVPSFLNMAFTRQYNDKLYYNIGNQEMIRLANIDLKDDNVLKINSLDNKTEIIPQIIPSNGEIHLYDQNQIVNPGNYNIKDGEKSIAGLAFNHTQLESNMDFFSKNDLDKLIAQNKLQNFSTINYQENISQSTIQVGFFSSLWKWLIVIVLLLIISEVMIVKFWK